MKAPMGQLAGDAFGHVGWPLPGLTFGSAFGLRLRPAHGRLPLCPWHRWPHGPEGLHYNTPVKRKRGRKEESTEGQRVRVQRIESMR